MHSDSDRQIRRALREGGIVLAVIEAARWIDAEPATLPTWACVIASTKRGGSGSLFRLSRALPPPSAYNPTPGLTLVSDLARAIRDNDSYAADRLTRRIYHYAPQTGREALFSVLADLNQSDDLQPASPESARLFRALDELRRGNDA